ncbi:NAD(P)-binding protein [Xylaria sp. FL0043]|nr:NAD(P)-binding protein [Xylaria sp. FL0043]
MNVSGYVLIIGGGNGIGKATALGFAREGAIGIMIADIDQQAAGNTALECKAVGVAPSFRSESLYIDITNEATVDQAMKQTMKSFGRLDHCVITAGIALSGATEIADMDVAEFRRVVDVNLTGSFIATRAVSAIMRQAARSETNEAHNISPQGTIVLMGSGQSLVPFRGMTHYVAAKHAVVGLAKNAAVDNMQHGIRVNCVCPSWVNTPMVAQLTANTAGLEETIRRAVPMGRMANLEEVVDAIIFLSSPRSSYVTGTTLVIDSGTMLQLRV